MNLPDKSKQRTAEEAREYWRFKNRGAIGEIANQFGLSRTTVRRVFLGEFNSRNLRVEKEFARRGCPGFEEFTKNAAQ